MQIQAFSSVRPDPTRMGEMCEPATTAELDALVASGAYMQDLGRALYLVARRDGDVVRQGIVCCCDAGELTGLVAAAACEDAEAGIADAADSIAARMRSLGAHANAVTLAYEDNFAIQTIIAAAQTATPLYNLSNGAGTQVVVWRVSREDAVGAIVAAIGATEVAPTGDLAAAKAAVAIAAEARAAKPSLDARSPALHPLALLVPRGQDVECELLPGNGLLLHRFA